MPDWILGTAASLIWYALSLLCGVGLVVMPLASARQPQPDLLSRATA